MTLLDNTITGKISSSHCGPLKLQIQIAKIQSKNTVKKLKIKLKISAYSKIINSGVPL